MRSRFRVKIKNLSKVFSSTPIPFERF